MTTFIHISDLHFSKVSYNPLQIFSKRWIGNLNLFLFRKKQLNVDLSEKFLEHLKELKPDYVLISGDFTTTALSTEYKKSQQFIMKLKELGIKVFGIPGNHDTYTKKSFKKKSFYKQFRGLIPFKGEFNFDLEKHHVAAFQLKENHYLVLIDAACYTPYFQSNGVFDFHIEQHLQSLLDSIPQSAKIWVSCHFPFFEHEHKRRILIGGKKLKSIIERYCQVELFFHGHTHRQAVCDLRANGLPIISDSGSLTLKNKSTFNCLNYTDDHILLSRYKHDHKFIPVETLNLIRTQ